MIKRVTYLEGEQKCVNERRRRSLLREWKQERTWNEEEARKKKNQRRRSGNEGRRKTRKKKQQERSNIRSDLYVRVTFFIFYKEKVNDILVFSP